MVNLYKIKMTGYASAEYMIGAHATTVVRCWGPDTVARMQRLQLKLGKLFITKGQMEKEEEEEE